MKIQLEYHFKVLTHTDKSKFVNADKIKDSAKRKKRLIFLAKKYGFKKQYGSVLSKIKAEGVIFSSKELHGTFGKGSAIHKVKQLLIDKINIKIGTILEFESGNQYEVIKIFTQNLVDLKDVKPLHDFMPDYLQVYYSVELKEYKIIKGKNEKTIHW